VAALIDQALRKMGGAAGSSSNQPEDGLLSLQLAAAADGGCDVDSSQSGFAGSWRRRSSPAAGDGGSCSVSSSDGEAETAGGSR
jgi:hypothetical protein